MRLETAVVQLVETVPLRASVGQATTEPELAVVERKTKVCFVCGVGVGVGVGVGGGGRHRRFGEEEEEEVEEVEREREKKKEPKRKKMPKSFERKRKT